MAKILDVFPDIAQRRTRKGKHPWDEWFDGKPRELTRGVDFKTKPRSFIGAAYSHAKRHGRKFISATSADQKTVYFQAVTGA